MDHRAHHAAAVAAAQLAADRLFVGVGAAVREAVLAEAEPGKPLSAAALVRIMGRVDVILDRVYPVRRGAPSPLERLVATETVSAVRPIAAEAVAEIADLFDRM